jgi:hypothetical protein
VADGFQGAEELAASHRAAVGHRRPQPFCDRAGRYWRIGKTLAGERVHLQPVEERFLVYYCATLVRELDPALKRSTIVERFSAGQTRTLRV